MPRISVIVPVYNAGAFIDRCIESILDQSFSDFEVIFVDDGSTDRSCQAINQFARNDSRIVLHKHHNNMGPGAARNTGIAKARASYLTFIDSDDFVDSNLLERLHEAAGGGFFDIVESGCRAIDEEDEILWQYTPTAAKLKNLESVKDSMLLVQEWGMPQKLWKKTLFTENAIRFPEDAFWEDIAVVPILVVCARSLARIDFIGYNYVQHARSITNTRSFKHIADLFKAFEHFRLFLVNQGIFAKYRESFEKSVNKTVRYLLEHMQQRNLSNSDISEKLVRICSVIADEYLSDNRILERIPAPQFAAAIEASLELDLKQADATIRSAIRRILEAKRAN